MPLKYSPKATRRRLFGSPPVEARTTSTSSPSSRRSTLAASASSTARTRGMSASIMPWVVVCASAASTSNCIPLTISATCSASRRAACSLAS